MSNDVTTPQVVQQEDEVIIDDTSSNTRANTAMFNVVPHYINNSLIDHSSQSVANTTQKNRSFAIRRYCTWCTDELLHEYQSSPFPIKSMSFELYIIRMSVMEGYSYLTIKNCFTPALCICLEEEGLGHLRNEYGDKIKKVLRGLHRKYGYKCAKVEPCLPEHTQTMRDTLDLTNPDDQKADAVISFASLGAQRGDTNEQVQLGDVSWKSILEGDKSVGGTTHNTIVKDNARIPTNISAFTNFKEFCQNQIQ